MTEKTKRATKEDPEEAVATAAPAKAEKISPRERVLKMADELANYAVHVPTHGVTDSFTIGARLRELSLELRALAEEI